MVAFRISLAALCVELAGAYVLTGGAHVASSSSASHVRAAVSLAAAPPKEREKASFDTSIDEIPKCPETVWNADGISLAGVKGTESKGVLPLELTYDPASGLTEEEYFGSRREELLEQLTRHGAIWFRGFEMMKTTDGFERFYRQLGLDPCQDPLASVGARAIVNKKSAMYEAVNKPSRAKFFVGMHAESTFKRTNRLGAFVCFKPADQGGEFLLMDGKKVLRDLDSEVLARLYERGVRFSNAELPFFDFLRNAGPLRPVLEPVFKGIAEFAVAQKIDMELELKWAESEEDGLRLLALSPPQSPVNRHPETGEPSWFCNVHSHSRYLRDKRDGDLPESSGASKLNRTDMFFGDLSSISEEDLDHINQVIMDNLVYVPMSAGEVVLVDNYQCMHGRDVFAGERLHAVTWFQ